MSNLNTFKELLFNHGNIDGSDSFIEGIVAKLTDVLNEEEVAYLDELGTELEFAKVKEEFIDRHAETTSEDLNDLFQRYIWDDSGAWASEMYSVTDGIMSNLNMLESDALKTFIKTINKKDKADGRFQDLYVDGES